MAAAAGRAWRCRRARRTPRCTGLRACRRDRPGRARTAPTSAKPRLRLRFTAVSRPGSRLGRIDDISIEIGLASSSAAAPPPNDFGLGRGMNDQVIASTSPRAASARRARRARLLALGQHRARDAGGTRQRRRGHAGRGRRCARPPRRGRRRRACRAASDGAVTLMVVALAVDVASRAPRGWRGSRVSGSFDARRASRPAPGRT